MCQNNNNNVDIILRSLSGYVFSAKSFRFSVRLIRSFSLRCFTPFPRIAWQLKQWKESGGVCAGRFAALVDAAL